MASHLSARQPDEALQRGLLDVVHGDAFANADWSRTQTVAFLARLTEGLASPTNHTAIAEQMVHGAMPVVLATYYEAR